VAGGKTRPARRRSLTAGPLGSLSAKSARLSILRLMRSADVARVAHLTFREIEDFVVISPIVWLNLHNNHGCRPPAPAANFKNFAARGERWGKTSWGHGTCVPVKATDEKPPPHSCLCRSVAIPATDRTLPPWCPGPLTKTPAGARPVSAALRRRRGVPCRARAVAPHR